MADCAAHEAAKVEVPEATKCTEETRKPEVTDAGDGAVENSKETTAAVDETEASRKRKSEVHETDVADGTDEAKKPKTDDADKEANGDKAENGKEAEEKPKEEVAQKTVEDVQRLTADAEKTAEKVAA